MSLEYDILIIGGGIVGLTAALAMAKYNYKIAVIDAGSLKADTSCEDTRVYAINSASERLFNELEVFQHLDKARISPYNHMFVWDEANNAHIEFDSRMVGASNLGTIIEESMLKYALLKQIDLISNIYLFPEQVVEEVINGDNDVYVSSKQQNWRGQLLMVSDGAKSPVRDKLNVELNSWSYKQHALIATVTVEKSHQYTAFQVFHNKGPLAFLPLANPNKCSIVWSTEPVFSNQLMKLSEQEFNQLLSQIFAKKLGEVKVISQRYQFPLQMRHAKQYAGNRWLLLGDAAHTIHPLAGLGLNVGLADVCSWVKCFNESNKKLLSKKALGAYQRERHNAVWQIILLMEGFKQLFNSSFTPAITLRGLGLNLCNKLLPVKRLFIHHAQGLE